MIQMSTQHLGIFRIRYTLSVAMISVSFCFATACGRPSSADSSLSEKSKTCGTVTGPTEPDVNRAVMFCDQGVAAGMVVGVIADGPVLTIKVTREGADAMRGDRLSGEQLVKTWMRGWKNLSQSQAVTVDVEWEQVTIAKGQTTITSGDQVTFR